MRPSPSSAWILCAALLGCHAPALPEPRDSAPGETGPATETGAPDTAAPVCLAPGCVLTATSLGRFSQATLAALVAPGVTVSNGYEVFVVTYLTDLALETTMTLTLPIDATPPPDGWPLVVNAHGTVGLDDPCRLSGTVSGAALAGLFGARGTIGVAPDYPGLGGPGVHRYLDAESEAKSVLDAIRAATAVAAREGSPTSGRSAVVGLSQGGHAALSTAAWHSRYAPELDIRAFGAAGPASAFAEQWSLGVSYPGTHQVLHAMLAWSFAEAAGADAAPLWAPGFDPTAHLTTRCGWAPNFTGEPTLYDDFPTQPEQVFSPAYLAAYTDGSFTGFPFVAARFDANRIRPWLDLGEQTAPIRIWQGEADTVVPAAYTTELVSALQDGGIDLTYTLVPGATHTNTAFGFLASHELATDESVAWVLAQVQ